MNATYNWWGSNENPFNHVFGVTVGPLLILTVETDTSVPSGDNSTITAQFTTRLGWWLSLTRLNGHVLDGILVTFKAANGTVNPESGSLVDNNVTTIFTADNPGTGTVDGQPILGRCYHR